MSAEAVKELMSRYDKEIGQLLEEFKAQVVLMANEIKESGTELHKRTLKETLELGQKVLEGS